MLAFHHAATNVVGVRLFVVGDNAKLAFCKCGNNGSMVWKNLKQAVCSWQLHQLCFAIKEDGIWFGYFYFHRLLLCFGQNLFTLCDSFFNGAYHQECLFGKIVHLAIENHVESLDGVFDIDEFAFQTSKCFRHKEWL